MQADTKRDGVKAKDSGSRARGKNSNDPRAAKLTTKLADLVEKMPGSMEPDEVHKLRTTVRRVEVVLQDKRGQNQPKLNAQLKTLRKRAGKVRDLDVHLGMLDELDIGDQRGVDELRTFLKAKRAKQEKKLEKILEDEVDDSLEKRLKRAAKAVHEETPDPARAEQQLSSVRERYVSSTAQVPEDVMALHQLRIDCKRLRYEVEALAPEEDTRAANSTEAHAAEIVEQLKRVQDEIGEWHDWLTLQEVAQKQLHGPHAITLLALLRARTATHYHNARRVVAEVRSELEGTAARKKPPKTAGRAARSRPLAI